MYKNRISDIELKRKLSASGAVLIRGAKACGKTESAKQLAKSMVQVDRDEQIQVLFDTAPQRILMGETPRLIDEWQVISRVAFVIEWLIRSNELIWIREVVLQEIQ